MKERNNENETQSLARMEAVWIFKLGLRLRNAPMPYCSDTKSVCSETIWQPRYVTIIQDGGAWEI